MYSCDKLLEYVYPELAKQNSWKLPVWYYIANSDYKSSLAESKAPHSYNDIVSEDSIKRNRTAIAGRTAMEIWTQEKTNVFKAIRLLGFLPEDKIDVEQYQQILETIFKENANILSSSNTSDRSSLKRMIRIYDFLLYRHRDSIICKQTPSRRLGQRGYRLCDDCKQTPTQKHYKPTVIIT